jgi:hypothetical protein
MPGSINATGNDPIGTGGRTGGCRDNVMQKRGGGHENGLPLLFYRLSFIYHLPLFMVGSVVRHQNEGVADPGVQIEFIKRNLIAGTVDERGEDGIGGNAGKGYHLVAGYGNDTFCKGVQIRPRTDGVIAEGGGGPYPVFQVKGVPCNGNEIITHSKRRCGNFTPISFRKYGLFRFVKVAL